MLSSGYIYIVSFGEVESRLLLAVASKVKHTFQRKVRISSVPFPPRLGYNPARNQYHAGTILSFLQGLSYPEQEKLLALTDVDLYEEGLNFVFGEAQLGGECAIVSLYRLSSRNEELFFSRVFKEVNHELGHTFGLRHCPNRGCVMNFSNSLMEVDAKGEDFCPDCRRRLF